MASGACACFFALGGVSGMEFTNMKESQNGKGLHVDDFGRGGVRGKMSGNDSTTGFNKT